MTSAHNWDLVYGRPSFSKDAILFGIALALHMPLLLLQFKAAVKTKTIDGSLTVIDMRDETINKILEKGMFLPPKIPGAGTVRKVDLSRFVSKAPPALPAMGVNAAKLHIGIDKEIPSFIPAPLTNVPVPIRGAVNKPLLPSAEPIPIKDRGKFSVAPNTIQSLATGKDQFLAVSKTKTISLPTSPIAQAESGIRSPKPLASKILVPTLAPAEAVVPRSPLKVDARAGTAISVGNELGSGPEEELPMVRAKPRALTPEQRVKELFPIHGALKDRAVDRQEIPEYPEWARKQGIESSVRFKFSVTPDGRVKENIEIVQGSGYPELDELARTSLLRWMFARLPAEKGNLVQDGVIEFRFSIK
jgi:TonB family protein